MKKYHIVVGDSMFWEDDKEDCQTVKKSIELAKKHINNGWEYAKIFRTNMLVKWFAKSGNKIIELKKMVK